MENILVALDGSPRAPVVLAAGVDLARRFGAKLFLYRAVGIPAELPTLALSVAPAEVAGLLENIASAELAELAKSVPPEILGRRRRS